MTVYRSKIYAVLILTMLINSCGIAVTTSSSKESSFRALYPNCDINSTIVFLPVQPNYKFGDYINLSYKNTSQNQIAFPPDAGVKIFTYDQENSKWLEIKNNMQYSSSPEPYIVVDSEDKMTSYDGIVISPDTSATTPTEIRAAIIGHVYRDGLVTDECVGAFIDIRP